MNAQIACSSETIFFKKDVHKKCLVFKTLVGDLRDFGFSLETISFLKLGHPNAFLFNFAVISQSYNFSTNKSNKLSISVRIKTQDISNMT